MEVVDIVILLDGAVGVGGFWLEVNLTRWRIDVANQSNVFGINLEDATGFQNHVERF
ncbi:hypothetical protein D3C87_1989950 [compost metagenome]